MEEETDKMRQALGAGICNQYPKRHQHKRSGRPVSYFGVENPDKAHPAGNPLLFVCDFRQKLITHCLYRNNTQRKSVKVEDYDF